jgi:hypothetical protein
MSLETVLFYTVTLTFVSYLIDVYTHLPAKTNISQLKLDELESKVNKLMATVAIQRR